MCRPKQEEPEQIRGLEDLRGNDSDLRGGNQGRGRKAAGDGEQTGHGHLRHKLEETGEQRDGRTDSGQREQAGGAAEGV